MTCDLALIGFGEAGSTFALAGGWGARARGFDIDPARAAAMRSAGVIAADTAGEALAGAPIALSLVTADQALAAALTAAPLLAPGALWCDMNSVAPETKREAAAVIEANGGRYVDVAVMAPVNPSRLATPLLLSGPHAEAGLAALAGLGFTHASITHGEVGRASTIKMLRSVMYKGMEALTAECLIAAERAGLREEVLAMLEADWADRAGYRLNRMMVHGLRRAAEMEEAAKTLEGLDVEPAMTRGTVARQRAIGEQGITSPPASLAEMLETLAQ